MAEYKVEGGEWVCSSNGSWLPGSYESQKACRMAYRIDRFLLSKAWEARRNPEGIVSDDDCFTESDLRALAEQEGE